MTHAILVLYVIAVLILAWLTIRRLRVLLASERQEHLNTLRAAMFEKAAMQVEINILRAANRELAGEPLRPGPGRVYVRH